MLSAVALVILLIAGPVTGQPARPAPPAVQVYKSPTCGCCSIWVQHLRRHGFVVNVTDVQDVTQFRTRHKVPQRVASCHTALVGGYVVEGHVPAADIQRMLKEKPPIVGIGVPGMPIGSPGMEGPYPQPYDVLAFDTAGRTTVFASYRP
jgi:hypothetical protein